MKLSIIPIDGTVCEDGVCYLHLLWEGTPINVHALQWQDTSGWIEYVGDKPNETIDTLPTWAENAMSAWEAAAAPKPPTPNTAEENKSLAGSLLQETDWTQIPSVSDPLLSNPYLANKLAFDQYRNDVRQYAVYPVAGDIVWPTIPVENWVKV